MSKGLGNVVGVGAKLAMGGSPLSAFGGALAGQALSGMGGGGGGGADRNVAYGTGDYTYTIGGKPVDTSKYFIKGDNGVYNILPLLATKQPVGSYFGSANDSPYKRADGVNGFYADTILKQLGNDKTAIANFNKNFASQQNRPIAPSFGVMKPQAVYDFGLTKNRPMQSSVSTDYAKLAQYAAQQKNPFFMAYAQPQNQATQYAPNMILQNQISSAGGNNMQQLPVNPSYSLAAQIAAAAK